MPLTSALFVALALAAGPDRILLCRPAVEGDPVLARAEAVADAARLLPERYLDSHTPCATAAEAARAATRAGLSHVVWGSAEGRAEESSYLLILGDGAEVELARRQLSVPVGVGAVEPLREALQGLERSVPRPPARWSRATAWTLVGVGTAALAAGVVFALQARDQARRADDAATPADYLSAHDAWKQKRTTSTVALAAGGAAVAAGLVVRFTF